MDLADILQKYQSMTMFIVSMATLVIFLKVWWEEVRFYWLRVTSAMPVVGKIARLSKDIENIDNSQWMHSEKTLCANFLPHYQSVNKDAAFYDKCTSYLNKAQETGRDNLHFLGWILIAAMVFVEAMGFSFVLAGYTIPGASEAMQQYGALGIAFLISCLLVFLTHETGAELHKNRLVGKIRAWHDHGDGRLIPQKGVTLENNEVDEDSAIYQQLLNRVDTNPNVTASHKITISTIVFVLLVAVGATYVRNSVMNVELTVEAVSPSESGGGDPYFDPYADPVSVEKELEKIANETNQQAQQEILDDTKGGALVTFIVLAVIFVFLQLMGVLIGFFKGFAGKESKSARAYIGKFKTRDEFARYYDRKRNVIAQIAQKHLVSLQQKMAKRAQTSSANGTLIQHIANHSNRSFLNYVDMEAVKDNNHRKTLYTREQNYVQHQLAASASLNKTEPVRPSPILAESAGLSNAESLEARMARIKREKEAQSMTEEQKMAAMTDEELAQYMTEKGMI